MTLAIAVDDRNPLTVLSIDGDVDLNTAPELLAVMNRLIDDGRRALLVDLSGVGFCDSSGLSVLIRARNRLERSGGEVILAGATPIVHRVLEISGLTEVFDTYPSLAAARAARG